MGQHDLPIVTGRWRGIPCHERYCDMCCHRPVGGKQHFALYCPCFQLVRDRYQLISFTLQLIVTGIVFVWQADLPRVVKFIVDCF